MRRLGALIAIVLATESGAMAQSKTPGWQWTDQPDLYPMVELRARTQHTTYALREVPVNKTESRAELRRELHKGGHTQVIWRTTIADKQWTDLVGAAMVVAGDAVYVARYNRIASTCTLHAFAIADGTQRWSVTLHGIGPIAHSKWFNRVQLGVEGGDPVAFGNEGPGRGYVEVRDAATGALVANAQHTLAGRPHVLAEDLYRELATMLARDSRYRVGLAEFARRHNLTFASDADRVRAFRTAAGQLDGLPFGKAHTMRVTVRKDRRGYVVHAARR